MHNLFERFQKSLTSRARSPGYLPYSIWASRSFRPIACLQIGGYTITKLKRNQLTALDRLHKELRNGRPLSYWRRTLLKYRDKFSAGLRLTGQTNWWVFNSAS